FSSRRNASGQTCGRFYGYKRESAFEHRRGLGRDPGGRQPSTTGDRGLAGILPETTLVRRKVRGHSGDANPRLGDAEVAAFCSNVSGSAIQYRQDGQVPAASGDRL